MQNSVQELVDNYLSVRSCHLDYNDPRFWHIIKSLHSYHIGHCTDYSLISSNFPVDGSISSLPFVPVSLFKDYPIKSISSDQIYRTLTSSGTTGQLPSKIYLDRVNSRHQQVALSRLFSANTGLVRPNILIIDTPSTASRAAPFTARKAGILGFSSLCRKVFFALNDDYSVDYISLKAALSNSHQLLVFGFTYVIFKYLLDSITDFPAIPPNLNIVLLHGGGWKKLESLSLSTSDFNELVYLKTNIKKTINYYGMVEQTGSLFFECSSGFMHTNSLASIIPRDISSLTPDYSLGSHPRILQVFSALPTSYPGHSLLTDDLASLPYHVNQCTCGRPGLAFKIHGRLPKSEPRGCSDTHQQIPRA